MTPNPRRSRISESSFIVRVYLANQHEVRSASKERLEADLDSGKVVLNDSNLIESEILHRAINENTEEN